MKGTKKRFVRSKEFAAVWHAAKEDVKRLYEQDGIVYYEKGWWMKRRAVDECQDLMMDYGKVILRRNEETKEITIDHAITTYGKEPRKKDKFGIFPPK